MGSVGLGTVDGHGAIATTLAAWYASFAVVTNTTFGREVIPVKELK